MNNVNMTQKTQTQKWDWPNILFITLSPVAATVGTIWCITHGGVAGKTWLLAFVMACLTGFSITGGYHRLFSHRSYKTNALIRFFYLLFGIAAFEGSAREWCTQHRMHHKDVDTTNDPYNIKQGFWHAHVLWIFKHNPRITFTNIPDLDRDPLIVWQHRYAVLLAVTMGLGFPALVASFWGDPWGGLFVAGFLRLVINHHLTFSINSFCHMIGKRPYSDKNTARDSWLLAFFTYGEGYHNFHHAFDYDYRNGIKAYQWDPTKWLIQALAFLGFADKLVVAKEDKIEMMRLEMDAKLLSEKLAKQRHPRIKQIEEMMQAARLHVQNGHARYLRCKTEYAKIKAEKMGAYAQRLNELRIEMRQAHADFKRAKAQWRQVMRGQFVRA